MQIKKDNQEETSLSFCKYPHSESWDLFKILTKANKQVMDHKKNRKDPCTHMHVREISTCMNNLRFVNMYMRKELCKKF